MAALLPSTLGAAPTGTLNGLVAANGRVTGLAAAGVFGPALSRMAVPTSDRARVTRRAMNLFTSYRLAYGVVPDPADTQGARALLSVPLRSRPRQSVQVHLSVSASPGSHRRGFGPANSARLRRSRGLSRLPVTLGADRLSQPQSGRRSLGLIGRAALTC